MTASPKPKGIAAVVAQLKECSTRGCSTIGQLLEALGERGFGAAILLFALPNMVGLSNIPFLSSLLSVPMMLIALQLLKGSPRPWLPARMLAHQVSEKTIRRLVAALEHGLGWMERLRLLHQSETMIPGRMSQILASLVILLCGITLLLPIPLGNFAPGLGATLIALGLIERDGVVLTIGSLIGVVSSLFLLGSVIFGMHAGLTFLGDL